MNESILHFVWQFMLFNNTNLNTVSKNTIEIIDPGLHNLDAGPDFFNAKIRLDNVVWAGNVEMHIHGNDWYKHGHHKDNGYNNTILHVVFDSPVSTRTNNGIEVPILQLPIPADIVEKYNYMQFERLAAPCYKTLKKISNLDFNSWLDRMLVEKLEDRNNHMQQEIENLCYNWEELFFRTLARSLGMGINSDTFELWAKSFSVNLLKKHRDNPLQVEAICFGQAGFLEQAVVDDNYHQQLTTEYQFLRKKYNLTPIENHLWRFLRLRPANFPTIRLAQLAAMVTKHHNLFDTFISNPRTFDKKELFSVVLSGYWQNHYKFGTISVKTKKNIGKTTQNLILLNTIVPLLFLYGKSNNNEQIEQQILDILTNLTPEKNRIITAWQEAGIVCKNAFETQALIHLTKQYCEKKKCLRCRIGHLVIAKRLT